MVNSALTAGLVLDPEVALAIAYAPARARASLNALWALDTRLGRILRTTTEPMVGQMRLTWWHDAVARADTIAGEPVLAALADTDFGAKDLQTIVVGWETLLEGHDDEMLAAYANGRGARLFALAARALCAVELVEDAGAGWALVDLARHHSHPDVVRRALRLAGERLAVAPRRWSRAGRPLGALAKLARRDLSGSERQGSPRRLLAAATLAMLGR